jgi:hypothetical protein
MIIGCKGTKEKELLRNFILKNAMNNKIFVTFAAEILTFLQYILLK